MSKKNSKVHKQEPPKVIDLSTLQVARSIKIRLPKTHSKSQINHLLLSTYLRNKLTNKKVIKSTPFMALYMGKDINFYIQDIFFEKAIQEEKFEGKEDFEANQGVVNEDTQILFIDFHEQDDRDSGKHINKKDQEPFYGLQTQFLNIKSTITATLFQREALIKTKLGPLKAILLSGQSGTGKSLLIRHLFSTIKGEYADHIYCKSISAVELLSRVVGGAEEFIRRLFSELKEKSPSILAIEDIHLIFGKKEVSSNETTLASLLNELDKINDEAVVVIATYHSDRQLSPNIRSSGKFQKEIILTLPNHQSRLEILERFVENMNLKDQSTTIHHQYLKHINLRLNGFSVGEIQQIFREAYLRYGQELNAKGLEEVLKNYRPSEIKDLIVEVPEVFWSQIGGYDEVKKEIKKVTELPLKHPELFVKFGIDPIKGIMLYGPPGCSKTMMAKAIATESKLNFIGIKGPQLFSKYVGDSQRAIRNIFKRARACSPCIIFFDEIDALATQRSANTEVSDRVLCQLLNEMDGIEGLKEVVIVAATNRPEILDKALMRPGRFDYLIYVSPPDQEARKEIFKIYLTKTLTKSNPEQLSQKLAQKTVDYTGAEIALVCREAALIALEQSLDCESVDQVHFEKALLKIKNRLTKEMVKKYEDFHCNLKY